MDDFSDVMPGLETTVGGAAITAGEFGSFLGDLFNIAGAGGAGLLGGALAGGAAAFVLKDDDNYTYVTSIKD